MAHSLYVTLFPSLFLCRNTNLVSTQRDERVLVLWSNDLDGIIPQCRDFEARLIKLVWRARGLISAATSELSSSIGNIPSDDDLAEKTKEASEDPIAIVERPPPPQSKSFWKVFSWRSTRSEQDLESAAKKKRQMRLIAPLYTGLGVGLALCTLSAPGRYATDAIPV